jgi:hypothetical protein
VESGFGNFRFFGWRHITTPNEPNGVLLDVYQRGGGSTPITLRVTDAGGSVVETLEEAGGPGLHRVVWNLGGGRGTEGVAPGEYTVTLEAGGATQSRTVVVKPPVVLPRG